VNEARHNREAIIRAMLPAFPIGADYTNCQLRGGFNLRQGLLIVPPEKIRKNEAGETEVLVTVDGQDSWQTPPEGSEVVAEGTKLGFEHLDYVVHLMGSQVTRNIVSKDGQYPIALIPLDEVYRCPAPLFLRHFLRDKPAVNGDAGLVVTG